MAYKAKVLLTSEGGTGLSQAGSIGNVLTSDGSTWISTQSSGALSAGAALDFVEDFLNTNSSTILYGNYYWRSLSMGYKTNYAVANHPGIITNTSTGTNYIFLGAGTGAIYVGANGETTLKMYIRFNTLSNGTNRYVGRFGFFNTTPNTAAASNYGMHFEYSDNVNSGNWQVIVNSLGTTTTNNTTVAADTNWTVLKIVFNAAGTSVAFYINDTEVTGSPITTNIPTTGNVNFGCGLIQSSGTLPTYAYDVDLITLRMVLTSNRG